MVTPTFSFNTFDIIAIIEIIKSLLQADFLRIPVFQHFSRKIYFIE